MKYGIFQVVIDFIKGDLRQTSQETADQRIAICNACEVRDPQLNICTACSCYLPVKTKLEKASCPLEKW